MVVIVDGGSTKCDWVLLDSQNKLKASTETIGFNPNNNSINLVQSALSKNSILFENKDQVTQLFFYGAGCGVEENKQRLSKEFQKFFPYASVLVSEDLTAAAYSAYRGVPAIICILGTGSNSCFFDGKNIKTQLPSLGYLIGDEGSGTAIGKQVIRRFFMQKLPLDLQKEFSDTYPITLEVALQKMYHEPRPNAFLASFNKFVVERKEHPYFTQMVAEELQQFFEYHVLPYSVSKEVEINFIGSIAYYYQEILQTTAEKLQLKIGQIVQKPIENLVDYHLKYIL